MTSILEKEAAYNSRFDAIRLQMFESFADLEPEPIRRGRHGHSSATIRCGNVNVIVDIQMEHFGWDDMPDELTDEHPICLWASGYCSTDRTNVSTDEICWQLPFCQLDDHLNKFLSLSREFLLNLDANSFTTRNRLPSHSPDRIPNLMDRRPVRFAG